MIGVGDKVVCVDADAALDVIPISVGEVYTVRFIGEDRDGDVGVRLNECRNHIHPDGWEGGYYLSRFRPVQTTTTDISIFQEMDDREFGTGRFKPSKQPEHA